MNILIFSWRGPGHPHMGGAEIATHEHAKYWVKKGNSVTLFTSSYPGCKTHEIIDGVEIQRQGSAILGVHLAAFKWYVFGAHKKFDLIIDQFHGIPFFTPLYVKTKKIAYIHEVAKDVWWRNHLKFPMNYLYGFLGFIFEPLVFKLFYTKIPFMTVSESTKDDLVGWSIPKRNIHIVLNGMNLELPKRKITKENVIMYLGAVAKDKGVEDALKVFHLFSKDQPDWQYWIVGKGDKDYVSKLKQMAKGLSIDKKVKFFGFVNEKEKFSLLSQAKVLLNPSLREGWGLVNIEANACGTPVVAYNVAGICDSVVHGQTGLLVTRDNVLALSEVTKKIVGNDYQKFSNNARKWSSQFSWSKSTKESYDLISKYVKN